MRHLTLSCMIMASFVMTACSSSTTISEWSCPSEQPDGCFDVANGDAIALDQLTVGAGHKDARKNSGNVTVSRIAVPQGSSISPSRPANSEDGIPVTRTVTPDIVASRQTTSTMPAVEAPKAASAITDVSDIGVSPVDVVRLQKDPQSVRIPERLAMIRIGAFEDAAGNWHPASHLFIVIAPARWQHSGLKAEPFEADNLEQR